MRKLIFALVGLCIVSGSNEAFAKKKNKGGVDCASVNCDVDTFNPCCINS